MCTFTNQKIKTDCLTPGTEVNVTSYTHDPQGISLEIMVLIGDIPHNQSEKTDL